MATCLPLSWKLLIYARETLLVASERTPFEGVYQVGQGDMKDANLQAFVFHFE